MGFCLTGTGATLNAAQSGLRFTSGEQTDPAGFKITSISGLGRSVAVIDNSDLSIAAGSPKKYCFGNIHDMRPLTVGIKINVDDITMFPDGAKDQTLAADNNIPFPMGEATDNDSDPTSLAVGNDFVLTFPTNQSSNTRLVFSGAFIDDSGIELVNNDRHRMTLQIQPDGEKFWWQGNAS